MLGLITSNSKADKATKGLIVEPGEYKPAIDLFINGFKGLAFISFHSSLLIPCIKLFGLKVGEDAKAIISPV